MKTKRVSSKLKMCHDYLFVGICGLVAAIMLSGCIGSYGRLNWDPQVTAAFQNHDVQQGFNYYYYGIGNRTFAIAGISSEYVIKSRMWQEVSPDSEALKSLVSHAWENYFYNPYDPQGAHILNPEGNRVGIWYSSLRFVTVKFMENNRIVLMPDTPFLGGPEADIQRSNSSEKNSAVESTPHISHHLQASRTSR
ncbi:MAG: hypothetical protein PVG35_19625 [Desulfobacterales bacterium]|jgi:hypothetical protein